MKEKTIAERAKQLASIQGGLSDYAKGVIEKCCMQIASEQKEIDEEEQGKALLYAVHKTAERTKREMIDKACEWLDKELPEWLVESSVRPYLDERGIEEFRKAMEC